MYLMISRIFNNETFVHRIARRSVAFTRICLRATFSFVFFFLIIPCDESRNKRWYVKRKNLRRQNWIVKTALNGRRDREKREQRGEERKREREPCARSTRRHSSRVILKWNWILNLIERRFHSSGERRGGVRGSRRRQGGEVGVRGR